MEQHSGRKLDFRLFIEGIEVPCVSADLQINFDSPATCTMQIIYTPAALRMKARSGVEVFYREIPSRDNQYRLFFSGEIFAYSFQKTPNSVGLILQAVDDSSYWDTAKQYYVDYGRGDSWLFQWETTFGATGVGIFSSLLEEHASVLGQLLQSPPRTYPQLKGLCGGVIHVMEVMGGIPGTFRGFNDFFSMAELRRRIMAQVSASEADDTSVRIFNNKVFWQWLMRQLGSAGSMVTIRDMVKLIFQYIFHNVVPNPIARYEGAGKLVVKHSKVKTENTAAGKQAKTILEGCANKLHGAIMTRDRLFETLKYTVNTFGDRLTLSKHTAVKATPISESPQELTDSLVTLYYQVDQAKREFVGIAGTATKAVTVRAQVIKAANLLQGNAPLQGPLRALTSAFNSMFRILLNAESAFRMNMSARGRQEPSIMDANVFNSMVRLCAPSVDTPSKQMRDLLYKGGKTISPEMAYVIPRPTVRGSDLVDYYLEIILNAIENVLKALGSQVRSFSRDYTRRERLHNQIFRPDVWFIAPPKCNVLFPDDYISLKYDRNFLSEITRLQLTTAMDLIGSNNLTNVRYVAPDIQDVTQQYTLTSASRGVRLILPHEIYIGIQPASEFTTTMQVYAAASDQRRAIAEQEKLLKEQIAYLNLRATPLRSKKSLSMSDAELLKQYEQRIKLLQGRASSNSAGGIPYIQRAVNYMFFQRRFAARSLGVAGRFLPRLVAGFPAVTLTQPPSRGQLKPTHFVGMIVGLSHSGSTDGGVTNISFSNVREHNDQDDDFLNIEGHMLKKLGGTRKTVVGIRVLARSLAVVNKEIYDLRGKKLNAILKKKMDNAVRKRKTLEAQLKLVRELADGTKMVGKLGPNGGTIIKIDHSSEEPKPIQSYLDAAGDITYLGGQSSKLFYENYTVYERYSGYERFINMPVEEQVYPTWMSPVYRNEQVGKKDLQGRPGPYYQFFECGAITDDLSDTPTARLEMERLQKAQAPKEMVMGKELPSKTIKEAIEELASIYASLRHQGVDMNAFIDEYTYRPVATFDDMFREGGFRYNAYGQQTKLAGFDPQLTKPARLMGGKGEPKRVAAEMDTRKTKNDRVITYMEELNKGQGLLGG